MSSNQDATQAKFYVYVHVKADDGEPFYAGKGSGKRAWSTRSRSAWWKRIVAKHGLVVRIQKHFQDEGEAFASEIETIAILRDLGYELCNLTDGGEGTSGWVPSVETRAKISAAHSTSEARAALAERNRQRAWSAESRAKLSVARSTLESIQAMAELFSGESGPNTTLPDEGCRQMFVLRAQGLSQYKIAAQIGCSRMQVSLVLSGKRRRSIFLEFHPEQA